MKCVFKQVRESRAKIVATLLISTEKDSFFLLPYGQ